MAGVPGALDKIAPLRGSPNPPSIADKGDRLETEFGLTLLA